MNRNLTPLPATLRSTDPRVVYLRESLARAVTAAVAFELPGMFFPVPPDVRAASDDTVIRWAAQLVLLLESDPTPIEARGAPSPLPRPRGVGSLMTTCLHQFCLHKKANAAGWVFGRRCRLCLTVDPMAPTWAKKSDVQPDSIASMPEMPTHKDRCRVCGCEAVLEEHHFAPRQFFADADQWPTAMLCLPCHRRWHDVMRTPTTTPKKG